PLAVRRFRRSHDHDQLRRRAPVRPGPRRDRLGAEPPRPFPRQAEVGNVRPLSTGTPRLPRGVAVALLFALAVPVRAGAPKVRDRVDLLEQDLRDSQQHALQMQEEHAALAAEVKDMRAALGMDGGGGRTPADLAARFDALESKLNVLTERQLQSDERMSVLIDK